MVRKNGKTFNEISSTLDIELFERQIKENCFDFHATIAFVLTKMKELCAPIRDEEVSALFLEENLTMKVSGIIEVLDSMKFDLADFNLMALKRELLDNKALANYEALKFKEKYEFNEEFSNTPETRSWLYESFKSFSETNERIDFNEIYYDAVMSLLENRSKMPETFELDSQRFSKYRETIERLTLSCTLNLVLCQNIPLCRNENFLARLKMFVDLKENVKSEVSALVGSNEADSLIDKIYLQTDGISQIIQRRILTCIKRKITAAKDCITVQGLDSISEELESLLESISRIVDHNRNVHAELYDRILSSFVQ